MKTYGDLTIVHDHAPRNARQRVKHPPGRVVGVISRKPKGHMAGKYNPLIIFFTVNPYRKDYQKVIEQRDTIENAKLPAYEASLFASCFKNW